MFEQRLATDLVRTLRAEADRLIERTRADGPEAVNNPLLWLEQQAHVRAALEPVLLDIALAGVADVRRQLGSAAIHIDWNLANHNAAAWAQEHAGQLVTGVTETTRREVGAQVAEWSESAEGLPGLVDRLSALTTPEGLPVFNRARAEMIASTEATNTFASANNLAWQAAGYTAAVFQPAAHTRCRCRLSPATLPDGSRVQVWYTAKDELVCTQPIETPWGTVDGCRDLSGVIVSGGPWMGRKLSEAGNG